MDLSPEFIKMCGSAEEIQKAWKLSRGDWYIYRHDFQDHMVEVIGSDYQYAYSPDFIWLPRQDQFQEMMRPETDFGLVELFFDYVWGEDSPPNQIDSPLKTMEQFWLAFVMKELYHKKWCNGEVWLNEKPS